MNIYNFFRAIGSVISFGAILANAIKFINFKANIKLLYQELWLTNIRLNKIENRFDKKEEQTSSVFQLGIGLQITGNMPKRKDNIIEHENNQLIEEKTKKNTKK